MIIDCTRDDQSNIWKGSRVYCDGMECHAVVYADDNTGIVVYVAKDEHFECIPCNGGPAFSICRGDVVIVPAYEVERSK